MSVCWTGNTNPEKSGYLRLGGKLKPLDCRTNSSRFAERGQEMSAKSGKERGKFERVYTALYYTFYVADCHSGVN